MRDADLICGSETIDIWCIAWCSVEVEDLDSNAGRFDEDIHKRTHSNMFNLAYRRLYVRAAVVLQWLVDEWLELFRVLLHP